MNFYRKIFVSIFFPAAGISLLLLWFMLASIRKDANQQFIERYTKHADMVGNTLLEAEAAVEKIGLNAAKHLSTVLQQKGLPSRDELQQLSKDLGVSLFAIIDKQGKFIRDTVTSPDEHTKSLFEFCADYEDLVTGQSSLEVTPIIPSFPYKGPFKFIMIPSPDRSYILEAGMHLQAVSNILAKAMSLDENILALGLYSPLGFNFGTIYADGRFVDGEQSHAAANFVPGTHTMGKDALAIVRQLRIAKPQCCECKIKGVGDSSDYYYVLRLEASLAPLKKILDRAWWTSVALCLLLFLLSSLIAHWLALKLVKRVKMVDSFVRSVNESGDLSQPLEVGGADEISSLARHFNQMLHSLKKFREEQVALERASALGDMAKQVAHDIRSPLAALNTVVDALESLPEERRLLIQGAARRITDIANSLLLHGAPQTELVGPNPVKEVAVDLIGVVDPLVSEKRAQYRSRCGISIVLDCNRAFGLFARVSPAELARSLSNLVNNAVEAIEETGTVLVSVFAQENLAVLEVKDNGRGIAPELLGQIARRGVTHGKENGSGIGLFAARRFAESCGGRLELSSRLGEGTVARLVLPLAAKPDWFPKQLLLGDGLIVISLDDDPSIHLLWAERLKDFVARG